MRILNKMKTIRLFLLLVAIFQILPSCQEKDTIIEGMENAKIQDSFRLIRKPKKSKKILEDNVNGRPLYRHDEIYNYTYDGLQRCELAQLSKIIFGVETNQELSKFSFGTNQVKISTGLGRMPAEYSMTFDPRTNYIASVTSNDDAGATNITFNYNSLSGKITGITEDKGSVGGDGGGLGKGPTTGSETYTYYNFVYDASKNLTQYKLTVRAPSSTSTTGTYVKIQETVYLTYFSILNLSSDLSPFPRSNNLNALDLIKLSGLSYGVKGNKMISSIKSVYKIYDETGAYKSHTLKTTVKKDAENKMVGLKRASLTTDTNYTSDEVYSITYEY